ncbi:MAG: hypothetical protein ACRD9Q_10295 [Nitrososphaeraceae archaeon]
MNEDLPSWIAFISSLFAIGVHIYQKQKKLDRENISDLARRGLLRG